MIYIRDSDCNCVRGNHATGAGTTRVAQSFVFVFVFIFVLTGAATFLALCTVFAVDTLQTICALLFGMTCTVAAHLDPLANAGINGYDARVITAHHEARGGHRGQRCGPGHFGDALNPFS